MAIPLAAVSWFSCRHLSDRTVRHGRPSAVMASPWRRLGRWTGALDHDSPMASGRVRRLGHLVAEQLCYRPLTMLWRLWGIIGWLRRDREWGTQTRRGLDVSFEGPPAILEVEPSRR